MQISSPIVDYPDNRITKVYFAVGLMLSINVSFALMQCINNSERTKR